MASRPQSSRIQHRLDMENSNGRVLQLACGHFRGRSRSRSRVADRLDRKKVMKEDLRHDDQEDQEEEQAPKRVVSHSLFQETFHRLPFNNVLHERSSTFMFHRQVLLVSIS
ncbi:hypothetical protein TNIN_119841 [Trichonephila inaurata madagascariensis]|uniref:Uncharacterized protein n=1 Tax=Trichonephila inaurata madagascariensis TaxID=2747483 RepID=A0A8X6Y1M4_9ARAC|nr:hypothetical protein TNIN_119841 [Trichonephila inaurata madagascariensis]